MSASTAPTPRQLRHLNVWQSKPVVRALYQDFYRTLLEGCSEGRILEVGGGLAHVKTVRSDVIAVDIMPFAGIDAVADAHRLPFADGSLSAIIMLDVLHHLERPLEFFREASRVLRPGGRLAMIEPAMTPLARPFYDRFHEEPVDMTADPFATVAIDPDRDPFDANQAIPTLLFSTEVARRRFEQVMPSFRVQNVDWLSLLAYPLSGGLQPWSLLPVALVDPLLRLESRVPAFVRRGLAFRMMVALERVGDDVAGQARRA